MRALRSLLPLALGAALVAPHLAVAEETDPLPPVFAESEVFLRCAGGDAVKVQNGNGPVGWSPEAPTRSVTEGAGCGFADVGALYNEADASRAPQAEPFDPVFEGTVTGNLRSVTAELYLLGDSTGNLVWGEFPLFVWLAVDGKTLYYGPEEVAPVLETVNDGRGQKVSFRLSGLDQFLEVEEAEGSAERTVTLSVAPWYVDDVAPWVWDTVEVPGGLTFNDAAPLAADIRVRPGDGG